MYCHLVMCSETCMSKLRASLHSKCGENLFISVRSYLQNQSQGQNLRGIQTFPPLRHADSTGRGMSPTLLSDHSRDLKQAHSYFPDRGCSLFSPGVQFISVCCSVRPALPGHHHSHSCGATGGSADPPLVWE